ncbi:hypothetical protein [Sulfobacillus thermosulfidooxidans]|uniref:hypothetical protein n=1 Tax=Sulfobacillus thermosulfidooxidans TaxID=28034 RepID=UPI0002F934E1|nr:hypothetical protein [Sulfobacillus thermosulfidooxidans]
MTIVWVLSFALWSVVGFVAWKPQSVTVPSMDAVEIHRRRRAGVVVESSGVPSVGSSRRALADPAAQRALAHSTARLALPRGATAMSGAVEPWPMPASHD